VTKRNNEMVSEKIERDTRPHPLSGKYKDSFAFLTIRDRLPDILTKVIDRLVKLASKEHAEEKEREAEDTKCIISKLSRLKNEMQTDKELRCLVDSHEDVDMWNDAISHVEIIVEGKDKPSWFGVAWLHSECYMYRRILEAMHQSSHHNSFDPFFEQKSKAFHSSTDAMATLSKYVVNCANDTGMEELRAGFEIFLQYCLWGNKCDLSISSGTQVNNQLQGSSQLTGLREHIISNEIQLVWDHMCTLKPSGSTNCIDIVLDNSGFELYTDLCLAEYFLSTGFCMQVRFHVKSIPWFVSDVMKDDFAWTLSECSSLQGEIKELGDRWKARVIDGSFELMQHPYWTLPLDFAAMRTTSPDLYEQLSRSQLIIFKGDLNYRKLVGDRAWPHETPFSQALHGFCPAPLCTLRTLKADLVVGLVEGVSQELSKQADNWMVSGIYGVIQFCPSL